MCNMTVKEKDTKETDGITGPAAKQNAVWLL